MSTDYTADTLTTRPPYIFWDNWQGLVGTPLFVKVPVLQPGDSAVTFLVF